MMTMVTRSGGPVPTQKGRNKAFRCRPASTGAQTATNPSLPRPSCLPTQDNEMRAGGLFQTMAFLNPLCKRCQQRAVAAAPGRRQRQSQQERLFCKSDPQRQGLFGASAQIWRARKSQRLAPQRRPQTATRENHLAASRSRHENAEENWSCFQLPWQEEQPLIGRRHVMAALFSPPRRKAVSEPLKPHGDAAQLAVNTGPIWLSREA